jgi:hypothetical protein
VCVLGADIDSFFLDFVPGLEELCIAKFLVIHLNPTTTETGSQNLRQSDSHCHMVPPISPSHLSRITKEGLTDLRGLTSNWWMTGFHACGMAKVDVAGESHQSNLGMTIGICCYDGLLRIINHNGYQWWLMDDGVH